MAMNPRLLVPRASGFNPRTIANLLAWYDASDGASLFSDDAATTSVSVDGQVAVWRDKSGNGHHLTQQTANNRPLYRASEINGKPALDFDGSDDSLSTRDGSNNPAFPIDLAASKALTFIGVHFADTTTGLRPFCFKRNNAADYLSGCVLVTDTANQINCQMGIGSAGFATTKFIQRAFTNTATSAHIVTGAVSAAANDYVARYNGASQSLSTVSGSMAISSWLSEGSGNHNLTVGARAFGDNNNLNAYMNGKVAELLFFARVLTLAERQRIERYLAAKWGITLAPQVSNADAQDWIDRVYANGGGVSTSTANGVNTFCAAIDAAGIRDRFYRLNLFAGTGLNAALVPLYRGPTRTGTQYGNATDTNFNFVSGDYTESTGLGSAGNASKHLDTGFATNTLTAESRHLACYSITHAARTFDTVIGSEAATGAGAMVFSIGTGAGTTALGYASFDTTSNFCFATITDPQFVIGTTAGSAGTANALYLNGVSADTGAGTVATPPASNLFVMALNRASTPAATDHYGGRVGSYSVGLQLSQSQAEAYDLAMRTLMTALGR